jgi:hypothetical protein
MLRPARCAGLSMDKVELILWAYIKLQPLMYASVSKGQMTSNRDFEKTERLHSLIRRDHASFCSLAALCGEPG